MEQRAYTIGIIAGSGPEAGVDLWSKILVHTQQILGPKFTGDVDAARVVIVSEPQLGLSMDLRANEAETWAAMENALCQIAPQVDVFAIACNTLNWFEPQIEALLKTIPNAGKFLSFTSVLRDALESSGQQKAGLLAAGPVLALDDYSVYTELSRHIHLEVPQATSELHKLIEDVKRNDQDRAALRASFVEITQSLAADYVLLACTELPLIACPVEGKTVMDVTDVVAHRLAQLAVEARADAPQRVAV
ncbi:aspartate racemase [Pacificibacter maritimus]|uniref:Aspartate racemase n=1 Tax=Pacificibacter maritimus TaxID=762213 RepID=A0A3N4UIY9_9RHOB|nr:aspartate/glutamate racemase family protein [Pacificibacter maritimus]RPE67229.1 aspartate racemase [Pacificibacter maritimus]